jgi:hypothetical protein
MFGWASRPAMVFGAEAAAYFGYWCALTQATVVPTIWKTDGQFFIPVWQHTKVPTTLPYGIHHVWGPDTGNRIAARLVDGVGAGSEKAVIVTV